MHRFWALLALTMALAALGRTVWMADRLTGIGLPHTPLGPVSKSVPGLELLSEDLRVSVFEM
ncbi:hypothetical protein [Micromonospora sp. DT62]|uniref:hypothetical protein n=1 Tax=Micromonospora sp. DT62 TaxID=3416521 RepID=UPI003CE8B495